MDQRIGFCTTSDGVRIAHAVVGEGPPLVYACGWPAHVELEWETPHSRAFLEALAEGSTLVRYDMRGCGLSDRDVSDFSLEVLIRDLEAVVDHLALDSFALLSLGVLAGPIAVNYAARHPERVSRLVLGSAFTCGRDITRPERQRALIEYAREFGLPLSQFFDDARDVEVWAARDAQRLQQVSASPEVQAALLQTLFSVDVGPLLGRLTAPTLVLHGRGDRVVPFALGRELAARLPNAQFVPFQGGSTAAWVQGDTLVTKIHAFLGVEARPREAPSQAAGPVTVLFTDMEGSTALTQRLGDAGAQELMRVHNTLVREALRAYGGNEVKHTGDGIMASFASASRAVECAIALQKSLSAYCQEHPEAPLGVRIGLNAGEPMAEDEDLFGTAVQLAKRVCDEATPGQILVPEGVRHLVAGKGFQFSDRGVATLKGFEDLVRLYEVRWSA